MFGMNKSGERVQYTTDIALGEDYRDSRTGLVGVAIMVTFFEHGCERVTLEWEKDGEPHEATFDAPRLIRLSTEKQAETENTGGPMKGDSHMRREPSRRGPAPR